MFTLCLFAGILSASPHTEMQTDSTHQLAAAEVTAVAKMRPIAATQQRWTVDVATWQQRGAATMADILQQMPGLQVKDYGGAGAQVSLSARGMGSAHTVVSVDGFPQSNAVSGTYDVGRYLLGEFTQIAWSIGDGQPLLSAVRTLGAAHLALHSATERLSVGTEIGSFGRIVAGASGSKRLGNHQFGTSLNAIFATNDFPYQQDNGRLREWRKRGKHPLRIGQGTGFWKWTTATQSTQIRVRTEDVRQTLPGASTLYTEHEGEGLESRELLLQASHEGKQGNWQWRVAHQTQWQHLLYSMQGDEYPEKEKSESYELRDVWHTLGVSRRLNPEWSLAYAIDFSHTALTSNMGRFDHVLRNAWQQSLSLRWQYKRHVVTLRLLRHDFVHHVVGNVDKDQLLPWENRQVARDAHRWTWSVVAARQLWKSQKAQATVRATAQHLFRMPSFVENYYHHYGNANLLPERTQQFSVGLALESTHPLHTDNLSSSASPSSRKQHVPRLFQPGRSTSPIDWQASVDFYYNRVVDRILGIPVNQTVWRTTNVDHVKALGVDLSTQIRWSVTHKQQLLAHLTTSLQHVTDNSRADSPTFGLQLPYIPLLHASTSVVWQHPWANLSMSGEYTSSREATANHWPAARLHPYALLHLSLGRTFHFRSWEWQTQCVVHNATNTQYALVRGYPLPGRSVLWRNIFRIN